MNSLENLNDMYSYKLNCSLMTLLLSNQHEPFLILRIPLFQKENNIDKINNKKGTYLTYIMSPMFFNVVLKMFQYIFECTEGSISNVTYLHTKVHY